MFNELAVRSSRRRIAGLVALSIGGGLLAAGFLQLIHLQEARGFGSLSPLCRVTTKDRVVALTFDDGPDRTYTPVVLRLLGRHGARATFFLVGEQAVSHPSLVRTELRAGMQVEDHTWSHPSLAHLSLDDVRTEVQQTQAALRAMGAPPVRYFRAPFGQATPEQLAMVRELELTPVHWTLAIDHYVGGMGLDPRSAAQVLASDVRPGDIILAHDAPAGGIDRDPAMRTLELLLPILQAQGYRFVTLDELLQSGTPIQARSRQWFWQTGFSCPVD